MLNTKYMQKAKVKASSTEVQEQISFPSFHPDDTVTLSGESSFPVMDFELNSWVWSWRIILHIRKKNVSIHKIDPTKHAQWPEVTLLYGQ